MRNVLERLLDIQDAIARIMKYTQDGRYRFDRDELVQIWVIHNLYVIGEAARAIASEFPEFRKQHPEIAWGDVIHREWYGGKGVAYRGAPVCKNTSTTAHHAALASLLAKNGRTVR